MLFRSEETSLLYGLKIVANISYPDCPIGIMTKTVAPLLRILKSAKSVDTIVQSFITMQKIVEDDAGRLVQEYNKLLKPILTFIRSVDDDVIYQSLRTLFTLFRYAGTPLVNQAAISGEPIKICVLLYCTHTNPLMISLSKGLLSEFAKAGYAKDIGTIGKITIIQKLFPDILTDNAEEKKESLELLAYLSDYPINRENFCNVSGIKQYFTKLVGILMTPLPMAPNDA